MQSINESDLECFAGTIFIDQGLSEYPQPIDEMTAAGTEVRFLDDARVIPVESRTTSPQISNEKRPLWEANVV